MELTTPRLFLRFPRQEDTDNYMSFCHTEFVLKYNAMTVSTRDGVEAMLLRSAMEENMLVMEERSSGQLLEQQRPWLPADFRRHNPFLQRILL